MADQQSSPPDSENAEIEVAPPSDPSTNEDQHQTNGESSSTAPTKECGHCKKPELDPEKSPLKPCSKCQSVQYCSRDCQKADFKKHKKVCASAAQAYAQTAHIKIATTRAPKKDGHRGGLQKWQFDTS